jgi:protein-tyrosine-phosphatase
MAQAFFERHAPADVRAESAGSNPAREIWPPVVTAMREVGIDVGARCPVPVRSHILTLAYRRTCECLRKDTCDVLAAV